MLTQEKRSNQSTTPGVKSIAALLALNYGPFRNHVARAPNKLKELRVRRLSSDPSSLADDSIQFLENKASTTEVLLYVT